MIRIGKIICAICLLLIVSSCEDYLDKTVDTDLTVQEVFKNFNNAQGFVEEMYAMVVDHGVSHWENSYLFGEDAIGPTQYQIDWHIDRGNYWAWTMTGEAQGFFNMDMSNYDPTSDVTYKRHAIWPSSWAGIRKANVVIANADKYMVDATQQEKDAVLGQAYFFRAFFHHEIMKYWGSIPYIDKVLEDDWKLVRPEKWEDTALKIDKDFDEAIKRLPEDWDDPNWAPGVRSRGKNMFRITKGAALALKGKNLLFAASPLMQNSSNTYQYNKELCEKAVDAFAEVLKINRYQLVDFNDYHTVFYTNKNIAPYSSEFIFSAVSTYPYYAEVLGKCWKLSELGGASSVWSPTHNYIQNNFGMKDGLSCEDSPLYDKNDPWANRDPRFYEWITVDGDELVNGTSADYKTAQLYRDGNIRYPNSSGGSKTGYLCKKWFFKEWNNVDQKGGLYPLLLNVRLTDVYLMYAEASLVAYGINGTPDGYSLSALGAINKLRERVAPDGSFNVQSIYLTSDEKFMDEIRRERAVELCYEGHRWNDVRRWLLGKDLKYRIKTELLFDRNDEGKPINFEERVVRTKVFDDKHYWLPFPKDDVELYEGFEQNPGW